MPENGYGWSGGSTDPCTGQKRVFQASDGRTDRRTDGQPENIMHPAPKGGGITKHYICLYYRVPPIRCVLIVGLQWFCLCYNLVRINLV